MVLNGEQEEEGINRSIDKWNCNFQKVNGPFQSCDCFDVDGRETGRKGMETVELGTRVSRVKGQEGGRSFVDSGLANIGEVPVQAGWQKVKIP